jgi:hypothetical protein
MTDLPLTTFQDLLCRLQIEIRDAVIRARQGGGGSDFSRVAEVSAADTIYAVDKISEETILTWFALNWPTEWPIRIVMEGIDDSVAVVFPPGATPQLFCLIDPIDGTRNLMYDKRSAWVLAGLGSIPTDRSPCLRDTLVAAMTEIPVSRQPVSDQVSGCRGGGLEGLRCERHLLYSGEVESFNIRPSVALNLDHGFAVISKFFPAGKALLTDFEVALWERYQGKKDAALPLIFDDQYISTGGQFYELLTGRDRFSADLRPLAFKQLNLELSLACHPYDIAPALLLEEAGVVIESPTGAPIDAPIDTTTPVAWVAYASPALAEGLRPAFLATLKEFFNQ